MIFGSSFNEDMSSPLSAARDMSKISELHKKIENTKASLEFLKQALKTESLKDGTLVLAVDALILSLDE